MEAGRLQESMRYSGPEGQKNWALGKSCLPVWTGTEPAAGYDLPITKKLSEELDVPIIASGGVGNPQHIYEGFSEGKADAALAASIFHFSEYSIREVKEYLKREGNSCKALNSEKGRRIYSGNQELIILEKQYYSD